MRYTLILFGAFLLPGAVAASTTAPLSPLLACRTVADSTARLNCYEAETEALRQSLEKDAIVIVERGKMVGTQRSLFGLAQPNLKLFDTGKDDPANGVARLDTSVAAANEVGVGQWLITLVEGGVWETTDASRSLYVRKGQAISIVKGSVGGYHATIGGTSYIRVRRVR